MGRGLERLVAPQGRKIEEILRPFYNRAEIKVGSFREDLKFLLRSHSAFKQTEKANLRSVDDAKWLAENSVPTVHAEICQVLDAILELTAGRKPKLQRGWACDLPSGTLIASLAHRKEVKLLLEQAKEDGRLDVAEIVPLTNSALSIRLF